MTGSETLGVDATYIDGNAVTVAVGGQALTTQNVVALREAARGSRFASWLTTACRRACKRE